MQSGPFLRVIPDRLVCGRRPFHLKSQLLQLSVNVFQKIALNHTLTNIYAVDTIAVVVPAPAVVSDTVIYRPGLFGVYICVGAKPPSALRTENESGK